MKIILFFLFLFALCGCYPDPPVPHNVGVNVHFTEPKDGEFEMLLKTGVTHTRMDITWSIVERVKGKYDFSSFDIFINLTTSNGITPYMIFDYCNQFYDGGLSPYTDEGREAFASFACAAVDRYNGKGIIWEVYNEPNGGFWKPKPNVDDYVMLAKAVVSKIKSKYPNEIVIGPATSGVDLKFLEGCFKGGLLDVFDWISVHPYGNNPPEEAIIRYGELRLLMEKYGDKDKIVVSGEWGFTDIARDVGIDKQAKFVSRMWATNAMTGNYLSIWYDWHDDGDNATYGEDHFGLVYYPYHKGRDPVYDPKPSYYAAKTFTTLLNGYAYYKRHESILIDFVCSYKSSSGNGEETVIGWSLSSGGSLHAPVKGCFRLYDYLGEDKGEICDNGTHIEFDRADSLIYAIPTKI